MLDPLSSDGVEMLQYMSLFMEHSTPFRYNIYFFFIFISCRLGALFVDGGCGQEAESDTEHGASKELISAFRFVAKEKDHTSALSWIVSVS